MQALEIVNKQLCPSPKVVGCIRMFFPELLLEMGKVVYAQSAPKCIP
jgi:hypothetical protein